MAYSQVRQLVYQLEATLTRHWQRSVVKSRVSEASLHKMDASVLIKPSTSVTVKRGPPLPPLIVTSRNTMQQTLRQALKTTTADEAPKTTTSSGSDHQKSTFLKSLLKSVGLVVSDHTFVKTAPGVRGLGSRYDGPSNS